jgi:putative FmdB family regulatory protein
MPIYEYRCKECGVRYERIVFSMSAPAPACPNCQSEEVEKLISVPGGMSGGDSGVASCGAPRSSCSSGFS